MEKCSKKSKQLCLSLFKPSVMMLTTGFLCMASFQGLAAVEPSHNYGPNRSCKMVRLLRLRFQIQWVS